MWHTPFDSDLIPIAGSSYVVAAIIRADGGIKYFRPDGSEYPHFPGTPIETLVTNDDGTRTLTTGAGELKTYSANGRLIALWDKQHLQRTLSYDGSGRLSAVVDSRGRVLTFTFVTAPDSSQVVTVTTSGGQQTVYAVDSRSNLTSVTFPDSSVRAYVYENPAFYSAITGVIDKSTASDPGVRYESVQYDGNGRAKSSVLAPGIAGGTIGLNTFTFNADGTTTQSDPLGHSTTLGFTGSGGVLNLSSESQRCGTCGVDSVRSRTFDGAGYLQSITDFNGIETSYTYDDTRGLEIQRTEAVGKSSQRTVNTAWNANFGVPDQRSVVNANGVTESLTTWVYNTRGQATASCEIDPADTAAMSYACSAMTAPPAGAKVRRTVTTYCEQSDVTAGTCPLFGLVTSVNGPRATSDAGMGGHDDLTTYTYYQTDDPTCATGGACPHRHGDLWKVTNALGQVTETVSYDKNGRVTRSKDANGTLTDFAYHPRGWLTDRIVRVNANGSASANDATLHIDYDPVGNVKKVTQPDGDYLAYTYDDAHRLIKIADNLNDTIDYCPGGVGSAECLDAAGNRKVEQVKDTSGNIKRQLHRVYNQLGQLTQQLNAANDPVETSAGLSEAITGQPAVADGYDGNGNRVLSDDGLGTRTKQQYDGLNRLVATIQNYNGTDTATANTTTQYTYDARDNLRQVTDPDNLNTVYDYDGLNNLTGLHSPDTGNASYTYDAAGNRKTQTDARGVTSTYTYDALNRLTGIAYPTSSLNVSYVYDQPNTTTGCSGSYPVGRLTRMIDSTGSATYCYDRHGNVTQKTQVAGADIRVTQSTYTLGDRLATFTYPSGATVSYTRDSLGRVQTVGWSASASTSRTTLISSATYFPFGPLSALTFGNGRTLTKTYDQDYAIQSIVSSATGGLTLGYGVDVLGNVRALSASVNPPTPDRQYTYDPLYRLTGAQTGATPASPLESYTYGPTGDRLSAALDGETAQPYTYTVGTHQLASVDGVTRSADANGNLTAPNEGFYPTLAYDDRNRLAFVQVSYAPATCSGHVCTGETGATADYGYNGRGERVRKINQVATRVLITTTTTTYAYDEAGRLIGEYPDNGGSSLQTEYIYLDGVPIAAIRANQVYEIETDHLGTPRTVVKPGTTPATDVTVWTWNLLGNTFGADAPNEDPDGDGTPFVFNLRYPGQYYDAETGLNYNYYRDYEPATGRYVKSDPIGAQGGGVNTYAYVLDNPLNSIDPLGLDTYRCSRPIGGQPGSPTLGRIVHGYSCVITPDGTQTCSSQTPTGSGLGSPGRPTTAEDGDYYDPNACHLSSKGNQCMDSCLLAQWAQPRPRYSIIPFAGTMCTAYDSDVNSTCRRQCGVK